MWYPWLPTSWDGWRYHHYIIIIVKENIIIIIIIRTRTWLNCRCMVSWSTCIWIFSRLNLLSSSSLLLLISLLSSIISLLWQLGSPPFEAECYRATYRRISSVDLRFPSSVSSGARDLISKILVKDQSKRMKLSDIPKVIIMLISTNTNTNTNTNT